MTTKYRFALSSDIPALVEFGRDIHVQSRYAWMQYSASRTWELLEKILPNKQYGLMIAEKNGEVVGVLLALAQQYFFNHDFHAQIELFYVRPELRGTRVAMELLGACRRWADNRSVTELWLLDRFAEPSAYNRKLWSRLGLSAIGSVHSRWMDR